MSAIHSRILTPGTGRIGRATRVVVTAPTEVEVLGPVPFEPSMLRVRFPGGRVARVFRDELTALED